jgi:hypothetical protein
LLDRAGADQRHSPPEPRWTAGSRIRSIRYGVNTVWRRLCLPCNVMFVVIGHVQTYRKRRGGVACLRSSPH